MHDKILIVDLGSQVTQLIARRVREEKVYCEIVPYQDAQSAFTALRPKGVILSGGPASVLEEGAPGVPTAIAQADSRLGVRTRPRSAATSSTGGRHSGMVTKPRHQFRHATSVRESSRRSRRRRWRSGSSPGTTSRPSPRRSRARCP